MEPATHVEPEKLFVLGLDAATLDLILPWVEEGKLANFSRLLREGAWGPLESTLHPLSPPAWTSFITGRNPGNHGIYDFVVHKPGTHELIYTNGGMRRGASLWRLLSDAGKRVVILNVPMTYPPEPVNGLQVSGFDAPGIDSDFIHPRAARDEITRALGEFVLRDYPQGHSPESFLRQIHVILDFHRRLTFHALERYEWDFFMVVWSALDLVQHGYWQYMDPKFASVSAEDRARFGSAIHDLYVKVDGILGELLERLPYGARVAVVSDHGAGPCYKAIFINKWLESLGYLRYVGGARSGSVADRAKTAGLAALKLLHGGIKRHVPPAGLEWLKRRFPVLREKVKSRLVFSEIDWRHTRIYSFGRESTNLFVNLKGKLPQGTVEPGEEYERLRETVTRQLAELRDPDTGEPVVDRVYRKEEVYHGECLDFAPDLLVTWRDSTYTSWPGYSDRTRAIFESSLNHSDYSDWSSLQKGGNHRRSGILFLRGDGVRAGHALAGARIIDLAPTLLNLMGVPVPSDMDGTVLADAFTPEFRTAHPPQYTAAKAPPAPPDRPTSGYDERESKLIATRLRSLGYVD